MLFRSPIGYAEVGTMTVPSGSRHTPSHHDENGGENFLYLFNQNDGQILAYVLWHIFQVLLVRLWQNDPLDIGVMRRQHLLFDSPDRRLVGAADQR